MIEYAGLQAADQSQEETSPDEIARLQPPVFGIVNVRVNYAGFALSALIVRLISRPASDEERIAKRGEIVADGHEDVVVVSVDIIRWFRSVHV